MQVLQSLCARDHPDLVYSAACATLFQIQEDYIGEHEDCLNRRGYSGLPVEQGQCQASCEASVLGRAEQDHADDLLGVELKDPSRSFNEVSEQERGCYCDHRCWNQG